MPYAIVDTETNGLFDFKLPADAEGQARLAHLAAIIVDDDLVEQRTIDLYVRPDGWSMSAEAEAINGLTDEFLTLQGKPVASVLEAYGRLIDDGHVIVAFNAQFDCKVMRGEMRRAGIDDRFERTRNVCVMRGATDVCALPSPRGRGFKFPKLAEACAHFGIEQVEEHRAMADARAAFEIFKHLRRLGACPEPAVHYAKNRPMPAATEGAR